nr:RHS repeat-associated core domain-containing protein [Clostridiales bacterium]
GTVLTYYSYDNNGNLLSSLVGGNYTGTYTYDLFNREKSFTPNFISYTYYTYRADGLRHSIGSTTHCWDGTNIVCDIDGTDYTLYFRAISLIFYRENNTDKYYLKNFQGDTVQLTNTSGVVVKSYKYNGYGDEKDKDPSDNNPFRYRGEYYDKVTGTIYLRARSYSASRGVFTTEDPIRDGDNWYGYCGGNPVNRIDFNGEEWWHWALAAAIVVACVAATVITAGGFAAAAGAVAAVASGTAAVTTGATIAAGATIGSGMALGACVISAYSTSSNLEEFSEKGEEALNETVKGTISGAIYGCVVEYDSIKQNECGLGKHNSKRVSWDKNEDGSSNTKKSTNLYGRKGCPGHQGLINQQKQKMIDAGYTDIKTEAYIKTDNSRRFVDIAGTSPDGVREYYQVGVTNKTGIPNTFEGAVSRERTVLDDIIDCFEYDVKSGAVYQVIKENVYFLTYRIK